MRKNWMICGALVLTGAALSGCFDKSQQAVPASAPQHEQHQMTAAPAADKASSEAAGTMVDIVNGKGEKIGMASLKPQDGGVKVSVSAASLSPGEHGIHFHETGKCEAPDFKTAGSHLNPASKKHGFLTPEGPHAGDLPNLIVGADGTGKAEFTTKLVTLDKGKPNSLLKAGGTALVIHDKADDYITDPAGNSGDRIACGVIKG